MAGLARVYVSTHRIGQGDPRPLTVERDGLDVAYAREVVILGPSRVVYRPEAPNPFGARVWIESTSRIRLIGDGA